MADMGFPVFPNRVRRSERSYLRRAAGKVCPAAGGSCPCDFITKV
jgi:hypothetical protein